ncbi:ATP-binding protein [Leeuwenhoekiella sp. A16]|uniref:ATP-binding protein n=1 Tax=unclassified Leeuwenhoekiella TaxID=2615029 RepID=UPI003A807550
MKKKLNLTDTFDVSEQLLLSESEFDSSSLLVILTHLYTREVYFINNIINYLCGVEPDSFRTHEFNLLKECMHPQDYPKYQDHLDTCGLLDPYEEKSIILRLKTKKEGWRKFLFTNRLYQWEPEDAGGQLILTTALMLPANDDAINKWNEDGEELNLQQNAYHELLHAMDEAFCIIEMIFNSQGKPIDYLFLKTNPAFEKQINLKKVTGRTMREIIPDHEEHWFTTYGRVAKTGKSIRFQHMAEKIESSWLDLYAFKIETSYSGRVAVLFRNITERKTAEEKLLKAKRKLEQKAKEDQKEIQENSELLQTVFDTTNLAVAVLKAVYDGKGEVVDFKFIRINKVLQAYYTNKDPLGKNYMEISENSEKNSIFEALRTVAKTGNSIDKEICFTQNENTIWFRLTIKPQNGLLIAAIEDITERKLKAQELEDTIRFKQQLVRTSPETIVIINLNTNTVKYINKDIIPEAGITRERVVGMPVLEIIPYIHPRDREKILDLHKKLIKASEDDIFDIDLRLKLKENTWEWHSVRGKIFHRRDEQWVDEYVLLVRNINKQKETQKALLKAEKLSIQGDVALTLAHELRNPLASIGMATEVLEKKLENNGLENVEKYLQILARSTKTLNTLVNNLLHSSNYAPAVLKETNLAKIIDQTLEKARDRIYLSGIRVIKNYTGPYTILADKNKLQIALLNIIVNASEATVPDEGTINVSVVEKEDEFILNISDNGYGMTPEQIDRLFEAFYTSKAEGVGIGLSSVKTILEEHDAKVKVSSKPNVGTTFSLSFHNANLK